MLIGGSGRDEFMGDSGDDTLFGGSSRDVFAFGPGGQINLAADIHHTGITSPTDLVTMGMVSGGTTSDGTKFTDITIGIDTIRFVKMDSADAINHVVIWAKVG